MQEAFLHFIWQHQYFDKTGLLSEEGTAVNILETGTLNSDSGPDFQGARIEIDKLDWRGNVEIHTKASDWDIHGHSQDVAYDNVILHVVWEADKQVLRTDGTKIPTIALKGRVPEYLPQRYKRLVNSSHKIPCETHLPDVDEVKKRAMLDKACMERLFQKSRDVIAVLERNGNDWDETAYQLLSKNFGFKTNADQFFRLSELTPMKLLMKHTDNLMQVEALLFGQAGFLEGETDDTYFQNLKKEHHFLSVKYALKEPLSRHQWKFMRLRPANFPTLRIAQLAGVLCHPTGLHSRLLEIKDKTQLSDIFRKGETSDYWKKHYQFNKCSTSPVSSFGLGSAENIVVNTVVPILVAYGKVRDEQTYIDQAVALLQALSPENNKIIRIMKDNHMIPVSALDTQGMIQLYNQFCIKKRCLKCNIGVDILKKEV
ncbi:DUF2851 family protein [Fulvivirga sp. M361]|nr:DUF2851 family protein [Fulvivirga sp. M361]